MKIGVGITGRRQSSLMSSAGNGNGNGIGFGAGREPFLLLSMGMAHRLLGILWRAHISKDVSKYRNKGGDNKNSKR